MNSDFRFEITAIFLLKPHSYLLKKNVIKQIKNAF
jgi:hypothetical protein